MRNYTHPELLLFLINLCLSVVACGLQAFQQLCGFNTLMYYSATLFASLGFNHPTAVGLIVAGTNFLFTLVALKYIDTVGRRRILLWSTPGMVVGLAVASVAFHCKRSERNSSTCFISNDYSYLQS